MNVCVKHIIVVDFEASSHIIHFIRCKYCFEESKKGARDLTKHFTEVLIRIEFRSVARSYNGGEQMLANVSAK